VERGEFTVVYQPVVALDDGHLTGFEALVRWLHPKRGCIAPSEFLPLAEETELVIGIDRGVLSEACAQLHRWHERVGVNGRVSFVTSHRVTIAGKLSDDLAPNTPKTIQATPG